MAGTCNSATGMCGVGAVTPNASCNSLSNGVCSIAGICTCAAGLSTCGGATCVDLANDGANCGACGHNCQGGACAQGVCQAKLIASIQASGAQSIDTLVLSGTKLYVQFFGGGLPAGSNNTFEVAIDGSEPMGAPVRATTPTDGLATALDGSLYWPSLVGSTSYMLQACTIGNCASTMRTIATRPSAAVSFIVADSSAHQLVMQETNFSAGTTSIIRVSPAGVVTPIVTLGAIVTAWSSNSRPDRAFFFSSPPSSNTFIPSYVSTTTIGANPIPLLPSAQSGAGSRFMANDNAVYWTSNDAVVNSAPLPNGIVTGSPPVLFTGFIAGVVDGSSAFGAFSTTATDVVARCPLSSCTPVAIARGQSLPQHFLIDNTAVYWAGFGFVTGTVINVYAAIK